MTTAVSEYDAAAYTARTHVCPDCEHHSQLVVRWNGKAEECWCPRCKRTNGFRRRESLTAIWKRNPDAVPTSIAASLERKYGKPMTEQAVTQTTETAMVKRIEGARWLAELNPQDRQSLAHLAVRYGLDPLMKELTLYEGAPYIAIAGLIRIAHRQKMFAGLEDRPMTSEERQRYGYKAPFCWLVNVYRKDWKCAATGTGTADPANPFRNNPIERQRPEWMARSRAIRQALKLAFPHSLPFEEVESAEERGIDPETGEIIERQVTMIETPGDDSYDDKPGLDEQPAPAKSDAEQAKTTRVDWEMKSKPEAVIPPRRPPNPKGVGQPGAQIVFEPTLPVSHLCAECIRNGEPSTITGHRTEKRLWTPEDIVERSSKQYGEALCWVHLQAKLRSDKELAEREAGSEAIDSGPAAAAGM